MITTTSKYLFQAGGELTDFLRNRELAIAREIEFIESEDLLNASESDLCESIVTKFSLKMPEIMEDRINVSDHFETDIDVSQDRTRIIEDRNKPFHVKGTSVIIQIPFDGDSQIFSFIPPTRTTMRPIGSVIRNSIILTYQQVENDSDKLKARYLTDLGMVKQYLGFARGHVLGFNQSLPGKTKLMIKTRKDRLLASRKMVSGLGIPIKKRSDALSTYDVPISRKKIKITIPKHNQPPFEPEPHLDAKVYDQILETMSKMALVMERSPKAFLRMGEEDLRWHFLVQLNAQFEWEARAETFNFSGKTDILISYKNKNIFIAECKLWDGEKSLVGALEQLLGYTCWRDTKTAILLFSRRKNFTSVLEQIPEVVSNHCNFKKSLEVDDETSFRFLFGHKNDSNREITLTVMAFNIPT